MMMMMVTVIMMIMIIMMPIKLKNWFSVKDMTTYQQVLLKLGKTHATS